MGVVVTVVVIVVVVVVTVVAIVDDLSTTGLAVAVVVVVVAVTHFGDPGTTGAPPVTMETQVSARTITCTNSWIVRNVCINSSFRLKSIRIAEQPYTCCELIFPHRVDSFKIH